MIEKVNYRGWPNCYRLTNGEVELVVTTDVGPRIIRYAFAGSTNLFKEFDSQSGKCGESTFMPRGGTRLWMAPEDTRLSYQPDNHPVKYYISGSTIELTAPVEPETGLEKTIFVQLDDNGAATLTYRIRNMHPAPRELSPWALSMMAPGGTGITGFPPRGTHPEALLPTNPLVMWAFTNFGDPRWAFTQKYLILHNDPQNPSPTKAGHFNPKTWGAYLLGPDLFIKRCNADSAKPYPDFHCSYETFTNGEFLELETLGPLVTLQQGQHTDLVERWTLHKNIKIDLFTDEVLDNVVLPLL